MKNGTPKNRIRKSICLLLAVCLLLTGCGKAKNTGNIRVDLSGRVNTLDPQFCATALERCLMKNCMEGLTRRLPDGTLINGCAEGYTVSADGLQYTFTLRENLLWSDGEPLTAGDFVFAFTRLHQGTAGAAAAEKYAAIRGFEDGDAMGVTAPDDRTVIITLTRADPLLPEKLAEPESFPCREEYYTDTHARYGNTLDNMIFNGPYTVSRWESGEIRLSPNGKYSGETPVLLI